MKRLTLALLCTAAIGLLTGGLLPSYYLSLTTTALIWAIFASSVNVLLGYGGLVSLGHACFFGVSAYVVGILCTKTVLPGLSVFFLGIISAGVLAGLFGTFVLRVRGVYFMLITLSVAELVWGLAFKWRSLTGGDDGLPGLSRPNVPLLGSILEDPVIFYYFVLFLFTVSIVLLKLFLNSPVGCALVGSRENELRLKILGYNVWAYQYVAYVVSGLIGGLAGALQAYHAEFVSPTDLGALASAKVLLMAIFGGSRTFIGPILGAFLIILLENLISGWTQRWVMILGIIYIFVVVVTPRGLMGEVARWTDMRW